MIHSSIGRLRIIALTEGISFLLLLFIAMPLKYFGNMPEPNKVIGMIHGILFIGYVYLMIPAAKEHSWGFKKIVLVFLASLLPGGTFVADNKILRKEQPVIK